MNIQAGTGKHIYNSIGIGFGPSNIALAIAMEEIDLLDNVLFLEKAPAPDWQGEFLLQGSDIQHNPIRDFVTPRNPVSPYGFLSYLKSQDRLFDFLNLSSRYPPRVEYARYVIWTARKFDSNVCYSAEVANIEWVETFGAVLIQVELSSGEKLLTKTLSFGPGRSANVPQAFQHLSGDRIVHATAYKSAVARWRHQGTLKKIAVLGAGLEPNHPLLRGLSSYCSFREDGAIAQHRDYNLITESHSLKAPVFLNGVCETTHGFGDAGSFSLLSVRSAEIASSIGQHLSISRNCSTPASALAMTSQVKSSTKENAHVFS